MRALCLRSTVLGLGYFVLACGEPRAPTSSTRTADDAKPSEAKAEHDPYRVEAMLRGVNLAGAEFSEASPGVHAKDYIYPDAAYVTGYVSAAYFVGKGMNVFRLPFRWDRLQLTRNEPFDAAELERLLTTVKSLRALGSHVHVMIDPHNYGRYGEHWIGSPEVPIADFADFWRRLAPLFASDPNVLFNLMNEPHDMPAEAWRDAANAAIAAIRETGAKNLVLVPGNCWTGAHSWQNECHGIANSVAMLDVVDPLGNMAFDVHQYLDRDSSGTGDTCVSESIGVERLTPFTSWAKEHGKRGFIGEFNGGDNPTCRAAITRFLDHVEENADVYLGWTWWAAGPWWGDAPRVLEPKADGSDKPQMAWLEPYLGRLR
jgi:endoglucanase